MLFFQCMPYGMTPSVRHRAIIEVPYCYFIIVMNIVYTIQKNDTLTQGRRNEKKARGAENFKKAHCNYFELKPGFIDAQ